MITFHATYYSIRLCLPLSGYKVWLKTETSQHNVIAPGEGGHVCVCVCVHVNVLIVSHFG